MNFTRYGGGTVSRNKQVKLTGDSGSPYWNWVRANGSLEQDGMAEPLEANPDRLSDESVLPSARPDSPELNAIKDALAAGAAKHLSVAQQKVFQLVVLSGMSEHQTAEIMGISRSAVQVYLRRAGAKLRKIVERRMSSKSNNLVD